MMDNLFPFLATQTLQVALLAVAVWIVVTTCCKRRPHLAHALWLLVLIKCIVPPVFSSSAGVYSWLLKEEKPTSKAIGGIEASGQPPIAMAEATFVQGHFPTDTQKVVAKPSPSVSFSLSPTTRPNVVQTTPANRVAQALTKPTTRTNSTASSPAPPAKAADVTVAPTVTASPPIATPSDLVPTARIWQTWIAKVWLIGVALSLAFTLIRFLRFRRWIRQQEAIENHSVESVVNDLAGQLKLRKKVCVKVIDAEFGPAIMGLFRPTIVLPYSLVVDKTPEQLEPMLAHELIHFRRGDTYWSIVQVIACSLMWFHPLVWLASKNVTRESERCCDEETIANFDCDRANYARMLVDVLEQKSRLRIAPVVPGVRPANVTSSRLEQIMETDSGKRKRTPRWVFALVLVLAIVVIPGAAIVRSQEKPEVASNDPLPPVVTKNPIVQTKGARAIKPVVSNRATPPRVPIKVTPGVQREGNGFRSLEPTATQSKPSQSSFPPGNLKPVPRNLKPVPPATNSFDGASFGSFNPDSAAEGIVNKVASMASEDEQRKKILGELRTDKTWRSAAARELLSNLKSIPVDVEVRFWIDRKERAAEFLKSATLDLQPQDSGWNLSEQQISQSDYEKLTDFLAKSDDSTITTTVVKTYFSGNSKAKQAAAMLFSPTVNGVEQVSVLAPSRTKAAKTLKPEGAFLFATANASEEKSISLTGQLGITKLLPGKGRAIPLNLGSDPFVIESLKSINVSHDVSWSIPDRKVQVLRATLEQVPDVEMFVFVKATRRPAMLAEDEGVTLTHIAKIKDEVKSRQKRSSIFTRIEFPFGYYDLPVPPIEAIEATEKKPASPLSLSLRCGGEEVSSRSLSTTLKLANDTTLTIDGDIDSQQISVETVQIQGREFSFRNKEDDSFSASASSGSISFSRNGPLESSLKFSLRSNAKLEFAGIEFTADWINYSPNRIEVNGNARIKIPGIESSVASDRVVLDLQQLAFDFDGNVAVERQVEGGFPFLLKSNHVGWSLVSGEMQTDRRFNTAARSTGNFGSQAGAGAANGLGSSGFTLPISNSPNRRNGASGSATGALNPFNSGRSK
jgi:beta-lactamase regulating signal transducer with metallopeptidase domain